MGSLDDLKILDFSTLLPGPYATLMLADMGAEVLKICEQTGYRIGLSAVYRGYRSVCITGMAWKK